MALTEVQTNKALELLRTFQTEGLRLEYQGKIYGSYKEWDQARIAALRDMQPQLQRFLSGSVGLKEFKEISNKMAFGHNLWGFTSFSGQMFLNQIVNWNKDEEATERLLKQTLKLPDSRAEAVKKIATTIETLRKVIPPEKSVRAASVPFLLSYFWQIQNPDALPVYFHSSKDTLETLGLYRAGEILAENYIQFWDLHDELASLYSKSFDSTRDNKYWFVEHVLWADRQIRSIPSEESEDSKGKPMLIADQLDESKQELALIGTWKNTQVDEVNEAIKLKGAWASVWSFRVKDDARSHLKKPFYVYINVGGGNLKYRMKVADFVSSQDGQGLVSPWPDITEPERRGKKESSDGEFVFRTWFKVVGMELVQPNLHSRNVQRAARWTKTEKGLLNQGTFGYFYLGQTSIPVLAAGSAYSIEDAAQDLFLSRHKLSDILELLQRKKNVILQGPPGVGKSYMARRIAHALIGEESDSQLEFVQFHQSFGYEDFIQGFRPSKNREGFQLIRGTFYRFCERAKEQPERRFVFVIDEINRGNLSRIFGELMLLIETDKRGPKWKMPLAYSDAEDDEFYVPENVHILGLMNTADRSLAMVDYALRRRFAFVDINPEFESTTFERILTAHGATRALVTRIRTGVADLNKRISDDKDLGSGFRIGHSFFCPTSGAETLDDEWYARVIRCEVAPLLREYWFDQPEDQINKTIARLMA